jgi:hypothetical protein
VNNLFYKDIFDEIARKLNINEINPESSGVERKGRLNYN